MKVQFSEDEYRQITSLLQRLERSGASEKKTIRGKLRSLGYRISELGANTVAGFDMLVKSGIVTIGGQIKHDLKSVVAYQKQTLSINRRTKIISEDEVVSFPAIADENSEILVLGTMPGKVSLTTGEYYAQSGNLFWRIIQELFNEGKPFLDYSQKVECLKANHIALWDTLKSCQRDGSLDSMISSEQMNDLDDFLLNHPKIRRIVFNGKKPAEYYLPSIPYVIALSTSPSNRQYSDSVRIQDWKEAIKKR